MGTIFGAGLSSFIRTYTDVTCAIRVLSKPLNICVISTSQCVANGPRILHGTKIPNLLDGHLFDLFCNIKYQNKSECNADEKFSVITRLSNDLHRPMLGLPSALSYWALYNPGYITKWLQRLSQSGINLHEYCQREEDLYSNPYLTLSCACTLLSCNSILERQKMTSKFT